MTSKIIITAFKNQNQIKPKANENVSHGSLGQLSKHHRGHTEQGTSPPLSFREEATPRGAAPSKLKGENKLFHLSLWTKLKENLGL